MRNLYNIQPKDVQSDVENVMVWKYVRVGRLSVEQWFYRCVSCRINTLLSSLEGVFAVGKFTNASRDQRPIVFDVHVNQNEKINFIQQYGALLSACNIIFASPPTWKLQ